MDRTATLAPSDFNGTLAINSEIIAEVPERLIKLAGLLQINFLTATRFTVAGKLTGLHCSSLSPIMEPYRYHDDTSISLHPKHLQALRN